MRIAVCSMIVFTAGLTLLTLLLPSTSTPRTQASTGRVAWTSSRLVGTPEPPPPYRTERVFPKLHFKEPVTIVRAPDSGRLFVVELRGLIYSFPEKPDCASADLCADLKKIDGHWRNYGLAFHPRFAENRQVFLCYVLKRGDPKGSRVSRFTMAPGEPPRLDLDSEQILLEWPSGGHNGGCLKFGPDGFLYISTGDGSNPNPPDSLSTGQDVSDLLASILRIDVDAADGEKPYRVPADNPFVGRKNARPEVWAYGLRNPWKMSFDSRSGDLWVGDVGWEMWEMIYRVVPGGNYGWSAVESRQPVRPSLPLGPTPILPPVVAHDHTEARSITGGQVYEGQRLPQLRGAYIYGDYVTRKIWGLRHDGKQVTWHRLLADSPLEIIDFGLGQAGELYILDHGGAIHRLVHAPPSSTTARFPRRLSETGLFASVRAHELAPGVQPYQINAEPWADHASAERFFAVPGSARLGVYEKQNLQIGHVKGAWRYPEGTVFAKTLALELERGNPSSKRRLETQILHRTNDEWHAYTYVWNDEQTDAELAKADGRDRTFSIGDPAAQGQRRQQTWHFASRTECLICHTTRAGSILGFTPSQLNRALGADDDNQLRALERLGYFEKSLPESLPRIPDPFDDQESLENRARAYLHGNCAHCHRRGGGGTAPFELLFERPLGKLNLVGSRPAQGAFNIEEAQNVSPGVPHRSVLYYRMAKLGRGRMPYAGSGVVDERGLGLIHDWIASLSTPDKATGLSANEQAALAALKSESSAETLAAADRLLANTSGALLVLRALDSERLTRETRTAILERARQHPDAAVRDLFERFLPEEQRRKRLGSVVKPAEILGLPGDAARGRQLFFNTSSSQCLSCHRIGGTGGDIGPDLTLIGKKLDRAALLTSLLEPSRLIEPPYTPYLLETTNGALHSGILVRKSAAEVVLKDAQGKIVTVPGPRVETLVALKKSLMPELLLRDMTAQEVADLLAFLAGLR